MARGGNKKGGGRSFVSLDRKLLHNEHTRGLSHPAFRLLIDIFEQYRGYNNGDLTASWTVMQKRGWTSKNGLARALKELLEKGFLVQTRQGGRHQCSLYAVTFEALDDCPRKGLDRPPKGNETKQPLGYWKLGFNPEYGKPAPNVGRATPNVGQGNDEGKAS